MREPARLTVLIAVLALLAPSAAVAATIRHPSPHAKAPSSSGGSAAPHPQTKAGSSTGGGTTAPSTGSRSPSTGAGSGSGSGHEGSEGTSSGTATAPATAPALPYTGLDAGLVALAGISLLAAGAAIRLRLRAQRD